MKIALYARVSTQDQTCEQQLTALREYVQARGWDVQGEYVDQISGSKDTRPAMTKLMASARLRQIDAIVCWKLDRWGRSMAHFVASLQELTSLGVRFIAITQGIDTDESNPTSRLMLNLLAAFSEFERELIVERTRAGLARARRAGKAIGRPKVIVNRDRLAELSARGLSSGQIASQVGGISPATVRRMLAQS